VKRRAAESSCSETFSFNDSRLTGRRADFVSILQAYDLTTMKEGAMHCPACHRAMLSTSSQAFEDEKGAMTITRWRCRPCHETAEEIRLSAGYRGPGPMRIRYTVASQPAPQVTVPARVSAKRGIHAYAGAS